MLLFVSCWLLLWSMSHVQIQAQIDVDTVFSAEFCSHLAVLLLFVDVLFCCTALQFIHDNVVVVVTVCYTYCCCSVDVTVGCLYTYVVVRYHIRLPKYNIRQYIHSTM